MKAGEKGRITCLIHGGRPAPYISLKIDDFDKNTLIDDEQVQNKTEEGVYESVDRLFVNLTEADNGKTALCSAIQNDGDNVPLFGMFKVKNVTLNVTFAPTALTEQMLEAEVGEEAAFVVRFKANPPPTLISWILIEADINGNVDGINDTVSPVEMGLKHDDDKYFTSELDTDTEDGTKFRLTLVVKSVVEEDAETDYKLLVGNSNGNATYQLKLKIKEEIDGGGDEDEDDEDDEDEGEETGDGDDDDDDEKEEEGGGSTGTIVGIVIFVIVCLIVFGGICFLKKKRGSSETSPLSAMEGRR